MNALRNSVRLIGHLGNQPEMKEFGNGKRLVRFSLATNESHRNENGERVTDTSWHNLIAWGKTAEIAGKYLKKGKEVAIKGRLQQRHYEDKDGNTRYITEVVVNELLMLGAKD